MTPQSRWNSRNRSTMSQASKRYNTNHPERRRDTLLRSRYGITLEHYNQLSTDQDHLCAICRQPASRLVVDHDHSNGRVRGLLCQHCNRALGALNDDPVRLRAAANYLEHAQETQ